MKPTWFHYAACILCSGGLLFNGTGMADEKSDMDKRMMECAATTATDQLGKCLASKGAPAVNATESDADLHAAVLKCAERGVTGTIELGSCVNSRLDETNTQPVDVTDAQIEDAAQLCSKHYTETKDIAVCVKTVLRHRGSIKTD